MRYYYQPGTWFDDDNYVYWADAVTTKRRDVVRLARAMARERGGIPVYGYWRRRQGPSPGPDAVIDVVVCGRERHRASRVRVPCPK
jgi:hypothetical protein